jgi:hypothetical protein
MESMVDENAPVREPPNPGQDVVKGIIDAGPGEIICLPGSALYEARTKSYWSLSPQVRPWAIIQPRSSTEVSKVMKVLAAVPECKFAIRRYVDIDAR